LNATTTTTTSTEEFSYYCRQRLNHYYNLRVSGIAHLEEIHLTFPSILFSLSSLIMGIKKLMRLLVKKYIVITKICTQFENKQFKIYENIAFMHVSAFLSFSF